MTAKIVGVFLILALAVSGCSSKGGGGGGAGGGSAAATAGGEYDRDAEVPGPWRPDRDYRPELAVEYSSGAEFCLRLAHKSRQRSRRLLFGGTLLGAGSVGALATGAVAIGRNEPVTRRERATNIAMPFIATAFGTLATLLIQRSADASDLAAELARAVGESGTDVEAAQRCNEAFGEWDTGRATAGRAAGEALAIQDAGALLTQITIAADLSQIKAAEGARLLEESYGDDHDPNPDAARAELATIVAQLNTAHRALAALLLVEESAAVRGQAVEHVTRLSQFRASLDRRREVADIVHDGRSLLGRLRDANNEAAFRAVQSDLADLERRAADLGTLEQFDGQELQLLGSDVNALLLQRATALSITI